MRILWAVIGALSICVISESASLSQVNPTEKNTTESLPDRSLSDENTASEHLKPVWCPATDDDTTTDDDIESNESDCVRQPTARTSTPLQRPPVSLFNLETANQLPAGAVLAKFGAHQTIPDSSPGTGSQLYYGGIEYGITDDLQIGLSGQVYDDPPTQAINGQTPNITVLSLAPSVKYRLLKAKQLSLSVQGSVELLSLSSSLFDTDDGDGLSVVGSVHVPVTYTASPNLQLHITPGVSILPGSLNDSEFYGTSLTLGTGMSWQPSEQWLIYSSLTLPIGPGGNTINSDQSIGRQPVWALGSRYNVTPRTGIDLYATNGLGVTPATRILTSIPEGEELLVGIALNYTPDTGLGYQSSFRETPRMPLSARDHQLTADGITLTSANTLQPGSVALSTGAGTNGNYRLGIAYSPDIDFELEAIVEDFGSDDDITETNSAGDTLRYMLGASIQLLDQRQNDPISLSARILGGRDTDKAGTVGALFVDLPITYQVNPRTALFFDPRLAAFGGDINVGLGLGINYEVAQGLQFIGEITPVFGNERMVWAFGGRYSFPRTAVDLELYATNAAGRSGLGTLIGQSDTQVGAGLRWVIGQ